MMNADAPPDQDNELDPITRLKSHIAELHEYVRHYLEARKDRANTEIRRLVLMFACVFVAGLISLIALGAATLLLLNGLAKAIGMAFGDRLWIGEIVVGACVIFGAILGSALLMTSSIHIRRLRAMQKYETRRARQRSRFGRDIRQQAAL
jgi:hypothetical protein